MSLFHFSSRVILRQRNKLTIGLKLNQPYKLQIMYISSLKHVQCQISFMTFGAMHCCWRKLCVKGRDYASVGNDNLSNNKSINCEPALDFCSPSIPLTYEKEIRNGVLSHAHTYNDGHFSFPNACNESHNCEVNDNEAVLESHDYALSESFKTEFKVLPKDGLDEIDLSNPEEDAIIIDEIEPVSPVSFNLAAYVNRSESLQQLIKLGVDLSKLEEVKGAANFLLHLDFESSMKPYIQFLHNVGVPADELGKLLTKIPFIFQEDLEHLTVRINYLESKKFSPEGIVRIITGNPYHLLHSTKYVDQRLGFFQYVFHLTGNEVRYLITKCPKLITYKHWKFLEKLFLVKVEMGFSETEMKSLLLMKPKVWMIGRKNLSKRFDIAHNVMGVPHRHILHFPEVLLCREFILEQRHKYLASLGLAQYDPKKPGYVSLKDFATLSDGNFARECAKTSVAQYNEFLKTL